MMIGRCVSVRRSFWGALVIGVLASTAVAQQTPSNIFPPAPRSFRQRLARAEKALAEERFSDAVTELGNVLSGNAGDGDEEIVGGDSQDYFLAPAAGGGAQMSLKAEVLRLLGTMPEKGRQLYELQFGAEARALLEEGLRQRDIAKLTDVTRKYFHTRAGYEATMLIGRHHLDQGQPLAAALCFRRVAAVPQAASRLEPELSVLLGTCWLYAQQPDQARQILVDLKRRMPNGSLRVGGRELPLFERDEDALKWLDAIAGTDPLGAPNAESSWVLFRGNAARNARSAGSMPLLNARWKSTLLGELKDEQIVQSAFKKSLDQGVPLLPTSQPLVLNDTVLARTPDQLVGIDFRTGKQIWVYPWFETLDGTLPQTRGEGRIQNDSQREMELSQRLWDDSAYGQISSDGERVYLLDKVGFASSNRFVPRVFVGPGGLGRPNPGWPTSFNQLVALDLRRQGSQCWIVGDENGWYEPKLAGAFFLGPPLPLHGELYVLAELNSEIRLVVLDARTGQLEWSQQIAHVENRPILMDGARRLAGATPSYADGVLLCPTSAGAVVAVDLATRSLLWGYQYGSSLSDRPGFEMQPFPPRQAPQAARWLDATVTIADGVALLTPVESQEIHALDLLTGRPVWTPKRRDGILNEMLYVACVHQGAAVLVGRRSMTAIRLSDGEMAWNPPLEFKGEQQDYPSGRGYYSENYYYLPTTGAQLLKIDLSQKQIVERINTRSPLGNLVCYEDQIVSLGADQLSVHYQVEPLRRRVDELLAKSADDPWALARRGELLLQDRKYADAFSMLLRARKQQPEDDSISSLLVTSYLAALEADFDGARKFAPEIEPLIVQGDQRNTLLRLLAEGARRAQDWDGAFDAYLRLVNQDLKDADPGLSPLEAVLPDLRVHRERWVQSQLGELLATAPEPARRRMDQAINVQLDDVLKSDSTRQLRQFVRHFANHSLGARARLELATRLAAEEEFLEAELVLQPVLQDSQPESVRAATAQLGRLMVQADQLGAAAPYYRRLQGEWHDVECLPGKTGRQLVDELPETSPLRGWLQAPASWPTGKVVINEKPLDVPDMSARTFQVMSVPVKEARGPLSSMRVAFDAGKSTIQCRDASGETVARVVLHEALRYYSPSVRAMVDGHLLLFAPHVQPIAIDLFRATSNPDEAILWPRDGGDSITSSATTGIVKPTTENPFEPWKDPQWKLLNQGNHLVGSLGSLSRHGVIYVGPRNLICVDPLTGNPWWIRGNVPAGTTVFGDDDRVCLLPGGSEEVQFINAEDGRLLGRRKLPADEGRWTVAGRNLVLWKQMPRELQLRLWDPEGEKDIWRETCPLGTKGYLVDGQELALLHPDGRLTIRSLFSNAVVIDTQLEPESSLASMYVLRTGDDYFVFVNRSLTTAPAPQGRFPLGWPVQGKLYSVRRDTGKPAWSVPAKLENVSFPPDQPADAPFLVFLGQTTIVGGQRQRGAAQASLLCVDKQTGRAIFRKSDVLLSGSGFEMEVDFVQKRASIALGGQVIEAQYTDEPSPVEAPIDMLKEAEKPASDSKNPTAPAESKTKTSRPNTSEESPFKE